MKIDFVTRSKKLIEILKFVDKIKDSNLPIVIQGETGTGKDLLAKYIHYTSIRREYPFVSESCGTIPPSLIESIFFGYVKGAFTGAMEDRKGLFEIANKGTVVLNEIEELSFSMQAKLLRVVQEQRVKRIGSFSYIDIDVRIIVSTSKDLAELVREGRFREDLYYRLNVFKIELPPLRERKEDIPLLISYFTKKNNIELKLKKEALDALMKYSWPGNVRELENELQRLSFLGEKEIKLEHLSEEIKKEISSDNRLRFNLKYNIEKLEKRLIIDALRETKGNKTKASLLLGLSRYGLLKKLKRYNLKEFL